jgi:hypothetical protein
MPNTTAQTFQTSSLIIGLDELAKVLRKTPDQLKRGWRNMHVRYGMPRKHEAGWFWSRQAIEVWLTSQAYVKATPGNDNAGEIPPEVHRTRVDEQNTALRKSLGVNR